MIQTGYSPNLFHMPFDFTAISGTLGSNISNADGNIGRKMDFLVREIATFNNAGYDGYDLYRLQFVTLEDNDALFSDPIGMGAIQSTILTPWTLPTPWLIPFNKTTRATLINMTGTFSGGSATNVTTQHCLIGELVPPGSYQSNKHPYGYSFYFNLGFNEDFTSGGNVTDTNNLYPSFRQGLPPLTWDFELTAILLDALNITVGDIGSIARLHKIQIFDRTRQRNVFNVASVDGNVCGERVEMVLDAAGLADPTGFPVNNVMQYILPESVLFKKGTQLTVKLAFDLLYAGNQSALSDLNQPANVVLMGNKIYG